MAEDLFSSTGVDLGNLEQYVKIKSEGDLTSNDQHIVNAVNHVLLYAFDQRASDIHIDPSARNPGAHAHRRGAAYCYKVPKGAHHGLPIKA